MRASNCGDSCADPIAWRCCAWAAETEIGHRGFLELGGAQLVNQAIEATAGSSMHFGDRLCDVLGDAEALISCASSSELRPKVSCPVMSHALIRDRIRVTLATHFSNEERQLLRSRARSRRADFRDCESVRDGLQAGTPRCR